MEFYQIRSQNCPENIIHYVGKKIKLTAKVKKDWFYDYNEKKEKKCLT